MTALGDAKRVLVIDNDLPSLNIYEESLDPSEWDMEVCMEPVEALEELRKGNYVLIVADLSLPKMSAIDFINQIREVVPDTPVIGVSSVAGDVRGRFFSGKISAFLQKPFTGAAFKAAFREILAGGQGFVHHTIELNVNELRVRNLQLRSLVEIAMVLGTEAEFDKLLPLLIDLTTLVLEADRATVFMLDTKTSELWSRAAMGVHSKEIRIPMATGVAGRVASTGETILTNDPYHHPDFNPDVDKKLGFTTTSILCVPICNSLGAIIGVCQVLNKNSERGFSMDDEKLLHDIGKIAAVRLENALLLEQLEQQKKLGMIGQLASGVCHEIKNLLAPLSFADMIAAKYREDEQVQRYTSFISDARNHAVSLLEEIRDIAKPSTNYEVVPEDLAGVAGDVVLFLEVDTLVKHHNIELDLAEGLPPVPINRNKIKQVIVNLIRNACQALPGEGEGTVTIHLYLDEEGIHLTVEDTGKGIPADQLEKIWQPFFSTKGDSGTGLGLDICRKILEAHGGSIACVSEVGKGSTFSLNFPPASYAVKEGEEEEEEEEWGEEEDWEEGDWPEAEQGS